MIVMLNSFNFEKLNLISALFLQFVCSLSRLNSRQKTFSWIISISGQKFDIDDEALNCWKDSVLTKFDTVDKIRCCWQNSILLKKKIRCCWQDSILLKRFDIMLERFDTCWKDSILLKEFDTAKRIWYCWKDSILLKWFDILTDSIH